MTAFDEARAIVAAYLAASWRQEDGAFYVAPHGYEDATHFHVVAGAAEALVSGDPEYVRMDGPAYLVDRSTGELLLLNVIEHFERLDRMRPVGASYPGVRE